MFVSEVREDGAFAGVFEYDGETGYFYLYAPQEPDGRKVLAAILVLTGKPGFSEDHVQVRWSKDGNHVGLFIQDVLWVACGADRHWGGRYRPQGRPEIPAEVASSF